MPIRYATSYLTARTQSSLRISEKMALSESQMIKECSLLRMPETQRSNGGKSDNLTGFLPYSHSSVLQEAYGNSSRLRLPIPLRLALLQVWSDRLRSQMRWYIAKVLKCVQTGIQKNADKTVLFADFWVILCQNGKVIFRWDTRTSYLQSIRPASSF